MAASRGRRGATAVPADAIEPLGSVRRSQLVSSFGIGAIVDLEKGSFMPMGLKDWERATGLPSLHVGEPRLQGMLRVSHFRLGPVKEDIPGTKHVRERSAAPAVRFPEWHECPSCNRIGRLGKPFELAADRARLTCLACGGSGRYTTPVRFVLACRRGHMTDFPWEWWAHRDRPGGVCDAPILYLGSYGRSAALSDLYVQCKGCGTKENPVRKSLGDAFRDGALGDRACTGFRPWLYDREKDCKESVRVMQRGASNVHFGVVCSALSIPPASEAVSLIVEEMRGVLDAVPESTLPTVLEGLAPQHGVTAQQLLSAYRRLRSIEIAGHTVTEREARMEEYAALSEDREDPMVSGRVPGVPQPRGQAGGVAVAMVRSCGRGIPSARGARPRRLLPYRTVSRSGRGRGTGHPGRTGLAVVQRAAELAAGGGDPREKASSSGSTRKPLIPGSAPTLH